VSFHRSTAPVVNCVIGQLQDLVLVYGKVDATFILDFYVCNSGVNGIALATIRAKEKGASKSVMGYLFTPIPGVPPEGGGGVVSVAMPVSSRVVSAEWSPKSKISLGALQLHLTSLVNDAITAAWEAQTADSTAAAMLADAKRTEGIMEFLGEGRRLIREERLRTETEAARKQRLQAEADLGPQETALARNGEVAK